MKKFFIAIICLIFLATLRVNAASFSMNLSGNTSVKVGEEVNVNISLNSISGISNGLNACSATLTSSGISINSVIGNGWGVEYGNTLIMDSSNRLTSSATIATIKATVNNAGSITISNIMCSDGENEYSDENKTINFTIKEEVQNTKLPNQINKPKLSLATSGFISYYLLGFLTAVVTLLFLTLVVK